MGQSHASKRGVSVIFDGDDTLWPTQVFYDSAKERFYDLMVEQGFDRVVAKEKLAEIDVENVSKLGFSKHRFPLSMREVYERLCETASRRVDVRILDKVREVGYSVFAQRPTLVDGATEVLGCLERHSYARYLYTVGDPKVQGEKLNALGVNGQFEAVYVRERKDEEGLRQILDEQGVEPESAWMVGNSLRSDIKPALNLGLRCIWVQGGSWEYDEAEVPLSDRVWRVSALTEALAVIIAQSSPELGNISPLPSDPISPGSCGE